MTGKRRGSLSDIGNLFNGLGTFIAPLVGVVILYIAAGGGESTAKKGHVVSGSDSSDDKEVQRAQEETNHDGISRLDAQAARAAMLIARDASLANNCHIDRPEAFARGEFTFESADADRDSQRYASAVDGYRKASEFYRACQAD